MEVAEFISHYGVKGMKWGVRRKSGGRSGGGTKFTKPANKLSNAEIKRRIERLETEKKYNKLNSDEVSAGRKVAGEILASAGRSAAKTVATNAAMLGVSAALSAKFGPEIAGQLTRRLK